MVPTLPDGVPDALRFAAVYSNPPVRLGKAALHDLLRHWIAKLEAAAVATGAG